MPHSFQPENVEHLKELRKENELYIQGINIQRATWLKKHKQIGKTSGSIILWIAQAEQADKAIAKGLIWKYERKATEIFKSGFRIVQCFNCQKYGHIAKTYPASPKCGNCAGEHNTRICTGKNEGRCGNCARKHKAWDPVRPVKLAAKARTIANRTQDPGR